MDLLRAPTLAAALVVALGALAATGVALAFAYDAGPDEAHTSMRRIEAGGAWSLVRALHGGSASVALVAAGLAATRAFLDGARPRAALLGGLTVALLLAAYESGAVLPSDQRAAEAWMHVRDGLSLVGIAPGAPLPWLAWTHMLVLGAALAGLAAWLTRVAAWSWRPIALALAAAVALALLAPPALGPAPVAGLAVGTPAWPFLWLVPLQQAWGRGALLVLPFVLVALTALAARSSRLSARARAVVLALVVFAFAGLTALAL